MKGACINHNFFFCYIQLSGKQKIEFLLAFVVIETAILLNLLKGYKNIKCQPESLLVSIFA